MIITTGESIEGKRVVEYKGLAFAKHGASDLNWLSDKPKYQEFYATWVKEAEELLKTNAESLGANAVIGVRQEVLRSPGMVILVLIGTAVVVE